VEEAVRIPCGDIELEGRWSPASGPALAAVLCHPHPLMGGDMNSPPVAWVRAALVRRGVAVLRFNFRGAGRSGGTHGGGIDEVQDVEAALSFVSGRAPRARLVLAGYSFGALVAARTAADRSDLYALGLVAPPLATSELPPLSAQAFPGGLIAVAGDKDAFCPADELRVWAERSGAQLELLEGEDHFLLGAEDALSRIFAAWLAPEAA
jgi:alpha/beta superfamily hydrolase